jgi:hypothetical protein
MKGDMSMTRERFKEILEEMAEIHERKNRDYAGDDYLANLKMCEAINIPAWKGVIVRMTDKHSRIMNLAKSESPAVTSESVNDTLTDLAVYAILARILIEEARATGGRQTDSGNNKRARLQRRRRKNPAQPQEPAAGEPTAQLG